MKNKGTLIFLLITAIFASFTAGIYLGGKLGHTPVSISTSPVINTEAVTSPVEQTQSKLNINTASKEALCELPGIGAVLAGNIIDYRETNGDFQTIEELKNVKGIGEKKFLSIYNLICVGDEK